MVLQTFSHGRRGQIVIDDDATDKDIYDAMYLDTTVPQGNGSKRIRKTEESDEENS